MVKTGERQEGVIERSHLARYEFASTWLKPGMRVLDVFCGTGYGANYMQTHRRAEVTGFDKFSKHEGYNFKFVQGSFPGIDFDNDSFDFITCFESIEHVKDFVAMHLLASMRSWLRRGGELWISTPNNYYMPYDKKRYPFHMRHYTPSQLETDLSLMGFDHVEWFNQDRKGQVCFEPGFNGAYMIARCK